MIRLDDEHRHQPGTEALWNESWYLDFWSPEANVGGYVRLGLYPNLGVSWYWACVVREGEALVTVIEHEAPLPRAPGLELRAPGLWTDLIIQTPLDHMTVGLEAFGVALDDPTEVYRRGWGDREALGLDLEWETAGTPFRYETTSRYEIACRVHGDILVGADTIHFDGFGQRDHSWGVRDWWAHGWCWNAGRLDDGTAFHSTIVSDHGWSTGYVGAESRAVAAAAVTTELDEEGLATSAALRLDDLYLAAEPVAWAPVLLTASDGRTSRFPRALMRYTSGDGRTGAGWFELNQPVPDGSGAFASDA